MWRSITDRGELKAWFPCDVNLEEWKTGADIVFEFPGHGITMTGTVLAADAPRLLAYTWGEETLRFELLPTAAGGTRLVLTDDLGRAVAARNAAGWEICLERLVGRAPAGDAWRPLFDHYVTSFGGTLGPQEGPPAQYQQR